MNELPGESERLRLLRDRLYNSLASAVPNITLNGPALDSPGLRLPGNLNVAIGAVDGETLLVHLKELALSSGSACSSADPEPSPVLRAIGLDEEAARSSIRFGLGRFNTVEELDFAAARLAETVKRLRGLMNAE
jgi:cysteine desulfurase